ncbi:tail fiber domain-containing protein, partial [Kluyvera intermedia]
AKKLMSSVEAKADATDLRLDTINGKSGGVVNGEISLTRSAAGYRSNRIVFTTIDNEEGLTAWAERHDFADSSNRQILNIGSVSGSRKAVLNAEGGILCRAGINNFSALRTGYFIDYESGPVALYIDSTRAGSIQLATTSDKLLKKEIQYLSDKNTMNEVSISATALSEVMGWKPATFKFKKRGIIPESETQLGFIANDL